MGDRSEPKVVSNVSEWNILIEFHPGDETIKTIDLMASHMTYVNVFVVRGKSRIEVVD